LHGIVLRRLELKLPIRVCSVPLLLSCTHESLALIPPDKTIPISSSANAPPGCGSGAARSSC
jgi:hypothetical protein